MASDFKDNGTLWESQHEDLLPCKGRETHPAKGLAGRKRRVWREAVAGLGSAWKESVVGAWAEVTVVWFGYKGRVYWSPTKKA